MNNIIIPLLIAVSDGNSTVLSEPVSDESHSKLIWIIAVTAIIVAGVIVACFVPRISQKIRNRKTEREKMKAEKERNAELERLHRIKKQNKRK